MSDGFSVELRKLPEPAARLKQISLHVALANNAVGTAGTSATGAAGEARVSDATSVFSAGMQGVLGALADDVNLLGEAIQRAGVLYRISEENATPGGN